MDKQSIGYGKKVARSDSVRVIRDMESFLDSLLAHTEEENCTHSINDFLQEYFDKKNGNGRAEILPNGIRNTSSAPTTTATSSSKLRGLS